MKRKPEESIRIFAANLILQQLDALSAEIQGVKKGKDIEFVHRMRVSSRRMRAILEVFPDCLPPKRANAWTQGIKNITNALGAARDTDVQIDAVQKIYKNLPEMAMQTGIRRLLLRLKQRRSRLQIRVLSRVDEFEKSGLAEEMRAAFMVQTARNADVYLYTPEIYRRAFDKIHNSFDSFISFEEDVQVPGNIEQLHAMRIAGKKFRYILECFSSIYASALKVPIYTMKNAQDLLGNIHDCDMWAIALPKFLENEHKKAVDYFGSDRYGKRFQIGIQYLVELKAKERDINYLTFIEKWDQWREEKIWPGLMQTLQVPFFNEQAVAPISFEQFPQNGDSE